MPSALAHLLQPFRSSACIAMIGLAVLAGTARTAAPFEANTDGTVTDTSTGLVWDRCTLGSSGDSCADGTVTQYAWAAALAVVATKNAENYKGYSDWRLPGIVELLTLKPGSSSIIDAGAFPNTPSQFFWSSSSSASDSTKAWLVDFHLINPFAYVKWTSGYVRLVRSGQHFGTFALSSGGVSGITTATATLTATSPVAATGYWLAVPRAAPAPTPAQIIAGGDGYSGDSVKAGNAPMTAKTPKTFAIGDLIPGTAYDLYVVARASTYNTDSAPIGPLQFTTTAIATRSIVIDPNTPDTLYAGLDGKGIYKSIDGGTSWTEMAVPEGKKNVRAGDPTRRRHQTVCRHLRRRHAQEHG